MAIIRSTEARELSDSELNSKLGEIQKELNIEIGNIKTGGRTSSPGKIRALKKAVARIKTILHQRKLGIKVDAKKKEKGKKKIEKKEEQKPDEKKGEKKEEDEEPDDKAAKKQLEKLAEKHERLQ